MFALYKKRPEASIMPQKVNQTQNLVFRSLAEREKLVNSSSKSLRSNVT